MLEMSGLMDAYVRRKRWEYREQALAIWAVLAEAREGGGKKSVMRVLPAQFLKAAGVKL